MNVWKKNRWHYRIAVFVQIVTKRKITLKIKSESFCIKLLLVAETSDMEDTRQVFEGSQKDWQPVLGILCVLYLKLKDINGNTIIQNLLHRIHIV